MNWRDITEWCLGANDEWGTCAFAMVGNHVVLLGKGVMNDGEVLNAAREIEGLNTQDRSTDKGESLQALFGYIQERGWPGDPTLTIVSWSKIPLSDVPDAIARRKAAPCWVMLPMAPDGSGYDFTDGAVNRNAEAVYAHAVLIVEATPDWVTFITWGRPQVVSMRWARRYLQEAFDVQWTDIT